MTNHMLNQDQRAPWKGYLTGSSERVEAEFLVLKSLRGRVGFREGG